MANEFYTTMQTKAFESQLRQLPESTKTLLPFCTREANQVGEETYFNQFGSMVARKGRVRKGKHERDEGEYKRRRVTPDFAYLATDLDCKDQVESLVDPRSKLAMGVNHALSRQMCQDTMTAAFGTAYTGKAGGTAETFNASDLIATSIGSTNNLNADKIVAGVELIQNQGFDLSDPANELTLVMGPSQAKAAKLDSTLGSFDYMSGKILSGIDIPDGFMGIRNVITDASCPYANDAATGINSAWTDNGLAQDDAAGNNVRMAFLFVKSAISYAMWEDPIVRVDELQEQHYDWQLYSRVQYGITRMYAAGGIVGLLCDQA
jgi:hypothetical protein